jgi:hypothetical protein
VTVTAGSASSTFIDVASTSAPTSTAAARRVSSDCRPVPAVRRWMIAISSGSHTTYAPCTASRRGTS